MPRPRGIAVDDPGRVRAARERKRISRPALATRINRRLGRFVIWPDTVSKIERGRRVEGHRLWPVLVELGLHPPPALCCPAETHPGEWVRDLRESCGIAPSALCQYAVIPVMSGTAKRRLSRTTLGALEDAETLPSWVQLDALAGAFDHFGVPVGVDALEEAWLAHDSASAREAWDSEVAAIRNGDLGVAARSLAPSARAVGGALGGLAGAAIRPGGVDPSRLLGDGAGRAPARAARVLGGIVLGSATAGGLARRRHARRRRQLGEAMSRRLIEYEGRRAAQAADGPSTSAVP